MTDDVDIKMTEARAREIASQGVAAFMMLSPDERVAAIRDASKLQVIDLAISSVLLGSVEVLDAFMSAAITLAVEQRSINASELN